MQVHIAKIASGHVLGSSRSPRYFWPVNFWNFSCQHRRARLPSPGLRYRRVRVSLQSEDMCFIRGCFSLSSSCIMPADGRSCEDLVCRMQATPARYAPKVYIAASIMQPFVRTLPQSDLIIHSLARPAPPNFIMAMEASDQSPGTRHESLRTRSFLADRPSESSLAVSSSGQVNRRSQNAQLLRNRLRQLLVRIRWFNLAVVTLLPLLAFYGACTTKFQQYTSLFSVWCYFLNMLGVTAGYHRLWSHRSYNAAKPLQLFLAVAGGGAMQGSIQWWARGHRSHHRYTDTDLDPYSAHVGFWHTHVGWMLMKPKIKPGTADVSDLKRNPVVMWQHRWYFYIAFIFGLIIPTCIPGYFWGDWRGGFFVAGCMRLTFVHHSVFSVNSVAHWLGDTTFDDRLSPRDHFVTALLTLGEGYHNFHHQFPVDYRNAVKWYQYDPTKWFIALCSFLGLASHLRVFPDSEVRMGQLTMQLKQLKKEQDQLKKPLDPRELPVVDWDEFQRQSESRLLVMISGFIHDVSAFTDEHPGGKSLITSHRGKDATTAFFGGVYDHSNAAHNLLASMRVGILQGGLEHIAETAIPPWRRLEIVDHTSPPDTNEGDAQVSFSISAFSRFSPKIAHYIGREKSSEKS